jgi:acyl-CoA synthetase (AMP-forming)/AMP-acid ligase II
MTPAGPASFLRTGDLGFMSAGQLYVTGRIKDLIIIRGRNLYPHDIEDTVAATHPSIRITGVAAFPLEVKGEERLAIVVEIPPRREGNDQQVLFDAIRAAVALEHDTWVHAIVHPSRLAEWQSSGVGAIHQRSRTRLYHGRRRHVRCTGPIRCGHPSGAGARHRA